MIPLPFISSIYLYIDISQHAEFAQRKINKIISIMQTIFKLSKYFWEAIRYIEEVSIYLTILIFVSVWEHGHENDFL